MGVRTTAFVLLLGEKTKRIYRWLSGVEANSLRLRSGNVVRPVSLFWQITLDNLTDIVHLMNKIRDSIKAKMAFKKISLCVGSTEKQRVMVQSKGRTCGMSEARFAASINMLEFGGTAPLVPPLP